MAAMALRERPQAAQGESCRPRRVLWLHHKAGMLVTALRATYVLRAPAPFATLRAVMRILILGGDGYLGWPTAMRFSARGHEVSVVDNFSRRRWHTSTRPTR